MDKKIARNIEEAIREKWQNFYVDDDNILCICVRKEHFNKEVDIGKLVDRLKYHKIKRIYEINTGGISPSHEMDLDVFDPSYRPDGVDLYWCSYRMDWAIKEDHDGYCYFVGKWLI